MRGVIYEHGAAAQADTARVLWPRTDDVLLMLDWTLMRDGEHAGMPLVQGGSQRLVIFDGAKSVGMPSVDCVFGVMQAKVVIYDLEFY